MKNVFFLLSFVFALGYTHAQQDINVYEKKDGNKNLIMARNTGKVSYQVRVDIHATGMDVTPGLVVETVVPPGHIKQVAEVTPRPGESWTYGYEVSFMEYTPETNVKAIEGGSPGPTVDDATSVRVNPPAVALSDARIIVYTKPGCGRCAAVKKQMDDRKIKYELVDVSTTSPEVNNMWKKLRDGGFTGDSVTMPVVRVDGKYHYNIKDLTKFVSEL